MGIDALDPTHPTTIPFLDPVKNQNMKKELEDLKQMSIEADIDQELNRFLKEDKTEAKTQIEGDIYQLEAGAKTTGKQVVKTSLAGNLFKNDEVIHSIHFTWTHRLG